MNLIRAVTAEGWVVEAADCRSLKGIDLQGARFLAVVTEELADLEIAYAQIRNMDLSGCNLTWLNAQHVDFSGCNLQGADMRWSNFSHCNFRGCDMREILTTGSEFTEANFFEARMSTYKALT